MLNKNEIKHSVHVKSKVAALKMGPKSFIIVDYGIQKGHRCVWRSFGDAFRRSGDGIDIIYR